MPLQVWLPLNGDLTNNGLKEYNLSMFRGTETYNASGKIGKCFYSNGVNTIKILNIIPDFYNYSAYSISAWFYIEARNTVHNGSAIISAGNWNSQVINLAVGGWSTDHYTELRVSGTSWSKLYSYNFNLNTWYHAVVSCDGSKTYAYVNGVLIGDTQPSFLPSSIEGNDIAIGGATYYAGMQFFGRINDVRIYNHCLSQKEIKELSKGLVAHYQLNDPYSTSNLIPNGNGDLGASGWSVSYNISTTEIPAVQTRIKASYYTNINNTYIPITQGTSYNFSVWLKQKESSGKTYPSFYPYDVDKKFIYHQSCADGFGAAYTTTLAQPLKKGDTVIYATDLSAWTTATNNYYFYCAIFGYKDSFGHTYADMTYTGDSPAFGTYSDKSHIDKTNNTITLNAPFTGEDRPAGTLICQATQGSGYYYPVGGIDVTAISDWTLKSATITPSTVNRLKYAKYIQFYAYPNAYYAGISLTDNQYMPEIVYDSSGYNYHGVSVDTEIASISPRNSFSTDFNSVTSYIEFPNLSFMPTMLPDEWTFSFWVYNNDAGSRSILFSNFNLGGVGSNSFGFEKTTGELLRVAYVSGKFDRNIPNSTLTVNAWTHIAVSKTKAHLVSVYRNGVLIDSYTNSNCASSGVLYRMGRDSRTDSTMYRGCLSDFRIYTTVLSADDILALYNAPVSIANNGTMFTQGEFVEG